MVKMRDLSLAESSEVFDFVLKDIKAKNRQKKSVVTYSVGSKDPEDPNNMLRSEKQERDHIKNLLDNDVIFVNSAGNNANKVDKEGQLRKNIDGFPKLWEGPDFPLIIVGATDFTGAVTDFSQGGPHLTILAPGKGILCQDKSLRQPIAVDGTSFGKSN